jgi:hypothetical protein
MWKVLEKHLQNQKKIIWCWRTNSSLQISLKFNYAAKGQNIVFCNVKPGGT